MPAGVCKRYSGGLSSSSGNREQSKKAIKFVCLRAKKRAPGYQIRGFLMTGRWDAWRWSAVGVVMFFVLLMARGAWESQYLAGYDDGRRDAMRHENGIELCKKTTEIILESAK